MSCKITPVNVCIVKTQSEASLILCSVALVLLLQCSQYQGQLTKNFRTGSFLYFHEDRLHSTVTQSTYILGPGLATYGSLWHTPWLQIKAEEAELGSWFVLHLLWS